MHLSAQMEKQHTSPKTNLSEVACIFSSGSISFEASGFSLHCLEISVPCLIKFICYLCRFTHISSFVELFCRAKSKGEIQTFLLLGIITWPVFGAEHYFNSCPQFDHLTSYPVHHYLLPPPWTAPLLRSFISSQPFQRPPDHLIIFYPHRTHAHVTSCFLYPDSHREYVLHVWQSITSGPQHKNGHRGIQ